MEEVESLAQVSRCLDVKGIEAAFSRTADYRRASDLGEEAGLGVVAGDSVA